MQQLQVVPISSLQGKTNDNKDTVGKGKTTDNATNMCILLGAGNNMQQMQLVQTADGQTFLYQPQANQQTIDQHQLMHQPTGIHTYIS